MRWIVCLFMGAVMLVCSACADTMANDVRLTPMPLTSPFLTVKLPACDESAPLFTVSTPRPTQPSALQEVPPFITINEADESITGWSSALPLGNDEEWTDADPKDLPLQEVWDMIENDQYMVFYPVFHGRMHAYEINRAIAACIIDRINTLDGYASIECRITCSTPELLSLVMDVYYPAQAGVNYSYPLTFDVASGAALQLEDFFIDTDASWRGVLPDIVARLASLMDITLLCEVPPIESEQQFYIESGRIVLLYRPYEIATGQVASPQFTLPMQEIAPYLKGAYGITGEDQLL